MENRGRTIAAAFDGRSRQIRTEAAWQWDHGQQLKVSGLTLPEAWEAHLSNTGRGDAMRVAVTGDTVAIDDAYLQSGQPVYVYIYLHEGANDGETEYVITIPVQRRAKPENVTPTPAQTDAMATAIAALNGAVTQTAADAADAGAAKTAAEAAQLAAETAQGKAETAQSAAEGAQRAAAGSAQTASGAAGVAETAQGKAEAAQGAAEAAQAAAELAAESASGSASDAAGSASDAAGSAGAALIARGKAEDAQAAAENARAAAEAAQTAIETDIAAQPKVTYVSFGSLSATSQYNTRDGKMYWIQRIPMGIEYPGATLGDIIMLKAEADISLATLNNFAIELEWSNRLYTVVYNMRYVSAPAGTVLFHEGRYYALCFRTVAENTNRWDMMEFHPEFIGAMDAAEAAQAAAEEARDYLKSRLDNGYYEITWESDGVKGISYTTGGLTDSSAFYHTDYVDIRVYEELKYMRAATTYSSSSMVYGLAFYDDNKTYISGRQGLYMQANGEPVEDTIDVPAGAVYARFTYRYAATTGFSLYGRIRNFIDQGHDQALIAEGYAAGTQDGTPVTSGSTYYENNAEYWANKAMQELVTACNSDAEDVDLDVTDSEGNVILRLEDGHIKTKEFDSSELQEKFDEKQDELEFDTEPTENSDNPVTSGGIYDALQNIEVDTSTIPDVRNSDADDVDLDVTDTSGNVIVRFKDGHIQTKEFDSRNIGTDLIMEDDSEDTDLDVVDSFGNVVARFADGHIQTKYFDSKDFEDVPDDIETIQGNVTDLQNATSGILYRTKNQTDGIYAACRYHQPNLTAKQFCLLLAGDIHTDPTRMENMIEYLNAFDAFDAGIMLGDISGNTFSDPITYYTTAIAKTNKPFLTVIGNHDVVGATSDSDLWDKYEDCFQYAGLASGEAVNGKCYYYKDFASYKIRIIVLMQYDYTLDGSLCFGQDQIDWFINVLQNTPTDYGVIIAEHTNSSRYMTYHMETDITSDTWRRSNYAPTAMNGDPVPDIIDAWISGGTLTQTYSYTYDNPPSPLSVDVDFSNRGTGEFISYIGGHWHMNVLGTPQDKPEQPDYHVPAAGLSAATQGDMPRRSGTVSEDSLNVLAVDREKKTVKVFQIGAHYTKDGLDRQYFQYEYGAQS